MSCKKENDNQTIKKVNLADHWSTVYAKTSTDKLGWYEEVSAPTLELIKETKIPLNAKILNVGAGSSKIIDDLVALGYSNIIASDLSLVALDSIKDRLAKNAKNVEFIVDDLTNPTKLTQLKKVDVWNDRAVLHFFISEKDRTAYFNLLRNVVAINGYVIIAAFAIDGAQKCCGLDVRRYNSEMLQESLGEDFKLERAFEYIYINPGGNEKPYIYTLFKRINT